MTTALQVLQNGALQKMSEADLIFLQEGAQDADAFTFIPSQYGVAPGGGKSLVDKAGEMIPSPLTGIVFDSVKTRGYWPEKDGNKIPFCSSIGGVEGRINTAFTDADFKAATKAAVPHPAIILYTEDKPLPASFSCASCSMNQWGSAHQQGATSNGKGCLEKRRLLFLPDGWHMPIIINLPTMSVQGWDAYCSSIRSKYGVPYYAVKLSLEIEQRKSTKNQPYGAVLPKPGERITDAATAKAIVETQKQFRDLLRKLEVEADFQEDKPAQEGDFDGRTVDASTGEILEDDALSVPF